MNTPHDPSQTAPAASPASDPSMEDILASIRRILSEDEIAPEPAAEPVKATVTDDVLVLDPSMMIEADQPAPVVVAEPPAPAQVLEPAPAMVAVLEPDSVPAPAPELVREPAPEHAPDLGALIAPDAAIAAAASLDGLRRAVSSDRGLAVSSLGVTIEDIVRQEIRLMLKTWLDVHLPPLVERLVQAEVERVAGRAAP